jgi:hypothetical protein
MKNNFAYDKSCYNIIYYSPTDSERVSRTKVGQVGQWSDLDRTMVGQDRTMVGQVVIQRSDNVGQSRTRSDKIGQSRTVRSDAKVGMVRSDSTDTAVGQTDLDDPRKKSDNGRTRLRTKGRTKSDSGRTKSDNGRTMRTKSDNGRQSRTTSDKSDISRTEVGQSGQRSDRSTEVGQRSDKVDKPAKLAKLAIRRRR